MATSGSGRHERAAAPPVNRHDARLVGRIWVKRPGKGLKLEATYCYAAQDIAKHFSQYLIERSSTGVPIADGLTVRTQASSTFTLASGTRIAASGQAAAVGDYLAAVLRPATGFALPVDKSFVAHAVDPIQLLIAPGASLGDEGYS